MISCIRSLRVKSASTMGGYKRKKPSGGPTKSKKWTKRKVARPTVKKMINAALSKNIETKTSTYTSTDGVEIFHNNFVTLTSSLLATTPGVNDPQGTTLANRIGDKINLRGVSLKIMYELNERYSDVTFRTIVIKSARGDIPTRDSLFNGISGNKMLDTINRERYVILADKWTKLKAPNLSMPYPVNTGTTLEPSGIYYNNAGGTTENALSRATKIIKVWLPGKKFGRSGVIQYENGSANQKFFDYHVVTYAYSNYSTAQDIYYVGRVNDFISQMYYKDA